MIRTAAIYVAAALAEIAGCFSFWAWRRDGRTGWLVAPGVASLGWLWAVEGVRPDRWDLIGACFCLLGAAVILFGRRVMRRAS